MLKNNKITELKVNGLFVAIGHDPATSLFKDQLNMDKEGYLITKADSTETIFLEFLQPVMLKINI